MDQDKVGSGDPRIDENAMRGGASMPGTPGFESEAAYRHREKTNIEIEELNANQLIPGPIQDISDEPTFDTHTLNGHEPPHTNR